MGRLPAIVIIARHGARLDAADNQWHLTSPTPYDPPLTYGGWNQSQALGARIASLLRVREARVHQQSRLGDDCWDPLFDPLTDLDALGLGSDSPPPDESPHQLRRNQVIIHTSPYLRCLQTAIGIGAGMAQNAGTWPRPGRSGNASDGGPSRLPTCNSSAAGISSLAVSDVREGSCALSNHLSIFEKPLLRVDAVLGEWLNPDYYESITPPPSAAMMVTGAKAGLLKRGDYSQITAEAPHLSGSSFPRGWGSIVDPDENGHPAQKLPIRGHSGGHGLGSSRGIGTGKAKPLLIDTRTDRLHYVAPTPTYAVSSSDPIPPGYVSYARDACVEVDYQWDSMREHQDWGGGSEYGEEWGMMHKRCRGALQKMLSWYKDEAADPSPQPDDSMIETVLVLVSHGAACNALIGALTDRPILMDVSMASLTLAVRKDGVDDSPRSSSVTMPGDGPRPRHRASILIAQHYDLKLIASTDHLRAPGSLARSVFRSTSTSPTQSLRRYRHQASAGLADEGTFSERTVRSSFSSTLGSILRVSQPASPMSLRGCPTTPGAAAGAATPSSKLWSEPASAMISFGGAAPNGQSGNGNDVNGMAKEDYTVPTAREGHRRGLWGSTSDALGVIERKDMSKRRWTVNDPTS